MPWLILFWLGSTATGVFAACDAIIRLANPIIIALNNLLTPRVAIAFKDGGHAALRRVVWKATALLSLFLCGFSLAIAVAGGWLLHLSFGDLYAGAGATLVVLALHQLAAKLALAPSRALLVLERANFVVCAEAAGLVTSLAAASLLVPLSGIFGAACSLLAGGIALSAVTITCYLIVLGEREERRFPLGTLTASAATIGGVPE
jgi:O-antigen/teichoic acid export membrane protein